MEYVEKTLQDMNSARLRDFQNKVSNGIDQLIRLQADQKRLADLIELTKKNLRELKYEPLKFEDLGL